MIAILPSAGRGGRLRPITENFPKVMVEINGKPLLLYHIENLKKIGVYTFLINLHYFPRVITDYFGDGKKLGINIRYSFEKRLLGTAGLLNNFRPFITEKFWFVAGDAFLPDFNFKKMLDFHNEKKSLLTIVLRERLDRQDTDFAEIDKSGKIKKLYPRPHAKKPPTNLDTCMVYLVEKEVLNYLPRRGTLDFIRDFVPKLLDKKLPIFGYKTDEYIQDIGTLKRYREAKDFFEKVN